MMSFFQGSSGNRFAAAFERAATRIEPLLPAVLLVVMLAAARWWRVYQFNPDEGFNLMKGALVASGFSLYSEIWSDQPPLLTFVLAAVQRVFPFDVDAARAVILAFSFLLLWSVFRSIRRLEGRACAWLAVTALMAVAAFQQLSVAVMIGLPAVALASAALDQTLAGASDNKIWRFWIAGALFALALQTKLFVGLMFPALALSAFLGADGRLTTLRIGITRLARVVLGTVAIFLAIAALLDEPLVAQLIMPHYRASFTPSAGGMVYLAELLAAGVPAFVLILFALGLLSLLRGINAARLIPVLWLGCAVSVLVFHRPLFWHQLVLIAPPIVWIAALALNLVPGGTVRRSVATACILFLTIMGVRAADVWGRELSGSLALRDAWRYPVLLKVSPPDSWVVVDELMDAYRAGRLAPPELAVWSDKRMTAGLLPPQTMISTLEKRRPERLLLRRFGEPRAFRKYLDVAYAQMPLVQPAGNRWPVRLYVRATANSAEAGSPAAEALMTATEALRSFAPGGGFAGHYEPRTGTAWGREGEPMDGSTVLMRPPASTQEVGSCFLRAHRITGAPLFWDAAKQAGRAIACAQGRHGGWAAVAHRNEPCDLPVGRQDDDAVETLDNGASQSAVRFLMDLAAAQVMKTDRPPSWLADSIRRGLDFLLIAQDENGGWPQQFPKTEEEDDYSNYATLNDGAITETIATLLHAYRQTGRKRYREAAMRGGDFLLKVQGPSSQPAWAQQYDAENRPAAARAFEPAAYASEETGFAMNALLDLYAATDDRRFLKDLDAAREWLERSAIRPGTWARLYEIGTNRPIYGDRDGKVHYSLADISEERRAGYRWEGAFPSVTRALARYQALLDGGIEGLRRGTEEMERRAHRKSHDEALALAPAIVSRVRPGEGWIENGIVSTTTFVENCRTLLNALEFTTP